MKSQYSMKAVMRLTGLSPDRLRIWERRYGAVKPVRTGSGRRAYNEQELNRLKLLSDLVRLGHSIGNLSGLSDRELVVLLAKSGRASGPPVHESEVHELLQAIGDFRLNELKQALARVRYEMSPREFAFRLVPQLMVQVGLKIDKGELSISQEHAISDIVRHILRQHYDELEPLSGRVKKTMVFAAPEGHYHDFGLLLSAIHCRFHGLETHFLGPNLPADSLVDAAKGFKASALVLGLSYVSPEDEKVEINQYLQRLDSALPRRVSLWVGGPGSENFRRQKIDRDVWVFASLEELEQKLEALRGQW